MPCRRQHARDRIVCPCHDVTEADIENAIHTGHTHPETIKRATAVYMGMCQGKYCAPLVQELLIRHGVEEPDHVRRPTVRVPLVPTPLGMFVDLRDDVEPDDLKSGEER
ncbi:MAG: (2Fe-2S)-binding protein [Gulosibacter sp.]|uniref:(2Fe-2S)-binding protein n=1 Tax=Gulosibacter sp. TaxID=2817531 RepID=UPI003F8F80CA